MLLESGRVKLVGGELEWGDFTAMDKYYENGPLPTWIGWYTQQLPHSFHAATVAYTLAAELLICWLIFFPRRSRFLAFVLTTPLQVGIILTANYAFLNYVVLFLGVLLLDDRTMRKAPAAATPPAAEANGRRPFVRATVAAVLILHGLTTTFMFFMPGFPTSLRVSPFPLANTYVLF